jgi:hypothetical protein
MRAGCPSIGLSPTDLVPHDWETIFIDRSCTFFLTRSPHSSPPHLSRLRNKKQNTLQVGDYSTSVGFLGFPYQTNDVNSVSDKVDELSTMLTAGRLSAENKQVILVRFIK